MKRVVCDANVVLDVLLDRPAAKRYDVLLREIQSGNTTAIIPVPAWFEIDWTLESTYQATKAQRIRYLRSAASLTDPTDETTSLMLQSLILYEHATGVNLADCAIVLLARQPNVDEFITGDKKLARLYRSLKKGRS